MIPSAIPVTMLIPKMSLILVFKKNTVLSIAIIAANKISKAPILDSKNVIPVKVAVIATVMMQNFIISCLL